MKLQTVGVGNYWVACCIKRTLVDCWEKKFAQMDTPPLAMLAPNVKPHPQVDPDYKDLKDKWHRLNVKTKVLCCWSMCQRTLDVGTPFCPVCTFVQLVFVKEDRPKPWSGSLTGNCIIMFSYCCFFFSLSLSLHHWTQEIDSRWTTNFF